VGGILTLPGTAPRHLSNREVSHPERNELQLELEIGAVAGGGGCVARDDDGRVVFVRHTLPGERVRARITSETSTFARADAVEVISASPDRVEPPCPHAGPGRCGGCDYQHVSLEGQRRLKAARIEEQLQRLAGVERAVEVESVPGGRNGLGWRSRVRLAVDGAGRSGFRRHRSHAVEPIASCPIAVPAVMGTGAFDARWPGAAEVEVVSGTAGSDGTAHDGTAVGSAVVTVTSRRGARAGPPEGPLHAGLVIDGAVRRPPAAVEADLAGRRYRTSPGVFWQAHVGAAGALLGAVLEGVAPAPGTYVADLYAGAGLFSVPLAEAVGPRGRVLAIERDRRACEDARHNGRHLGADAGNFEVRRAAVTPHLVSAGIGRPDALVLDPPRQGAGTALMRALTALTPALRSVVYVSCDPASFSRDLRALLDAGWDLAHLRAFDLFPMTEHVELVATVRPPAQG
jgi:tRNA/tmRNA/rRNA uracil-C5-methylase (TrmA/RlmC/RlmD family)